LSQPAAFAIAHTLAACLAAGAAGIVAKPFIRRSRFMKRISSRRLLAATLCTGVAAVAALSGVAVAQAPALKRTLVTRADVSVPGREAVVAAVEVAAGGVADWHTHPGEEISYVTEGQSVLLIAGQPPRTVSAGEAFVIPAGVVHSARNESNAPCMLVGVYVVEKGKPLASPAPAPAN
jgi:quercetin dioxygenase-like cupin family protein